VRVRVYIECLPRLLLGAGLLGIVGGKQYINLGLR